MASSGTFTAQDQTSDVISSTSFMFGLTFAGSGTVVLQTDLIGDGTWETVETYTATQAPVLWDAKPTRSRLKCTVYSADVVYRIAK